MQRQYENSAASAWFADVMENPERFPFRFTCGGTVYRGFGAPLVPLDADTQTEGAKTIYTRRYRASETLVLTLRAVHYADYGASEWTVWFENPGKEDSGILTDVWSELTFEGAYPMLKGILGDHVCAYRPYAMNPEDGPIVFTSNSGRATHVNFPYFNLECGDGGVLLAIGWAGTWTAEFRSADEKTSVLLRSVNNLRTRLKPGERIRTALFATVPYAVRDEAYATNCWRSCPGSSIRAWSRRRSSLLRTRPPAPKPSPLPRRRASNSPGSTPGSISASSSRSTGNGSPGPSRSLPAPRTRTRASCRSRCASSPAAM